MAIDPLDAQSLLTMHEAASLVPPKGTSMHTIHRWAIHGKNDTRLETIFVGGRRYTTKQALREFIVSTSEPVSRGIKPGVTLANKRRHAANRAKKNLDKAGI